MCIANHSYLNKEIISIDMKRKWIKKITKDYRILSREAL